MNDKICDIQVSQEIQDTCISNIKVGVADNGEKLDLLQLDVD